MIVKGQTSSIFMYWCKSKYLCQSSKDCIQVYLCNN